MSIFDTLFGVSDFEARAPRINTEAGKAAIAGQARQGSEQALAQAYSLAASGRGGGANQSLALREAQRRGAEATANLQGQAVQQQQALQQSVNQQQTQAEMQAQQINAGIAAQNAQAGQKMAGAALMAGAMMSDRSQKEIYSDFYSKEPPGTYLSQPLRSGVDPSLLSNQAVNQQLEQRRVAASPSESLLMARAADEGPSAVQMLGVTPEQAQQAQALRSSGGLFNQGEVQRQELEDRRARAGALMAAPKEDKNAGLMALGSELMSSDRRAKERAFAQGMMLGARRSSMTPGYPQTVPPPGYDPRLMPSDFRQKEDLDPVRPTLYRYTPVSSHRQALEAAQRTYATTLEDKRAPRTGIVAQDLQQSPAFAPAVVQKDDGQLAVDKDRALSAMLAELGQMHLRVKKLEGGKRGT